MKYPKTTLTNREIYDNCPPSGGAPFEFIHQRAFEDLRMCIDFGIRHMIDQGRLVVPKTDNEAAFDQLLHDPRELAQQDAPAVEQQPVAYGAFYFGGNRAGKLYAHCETQAQINDYIAQVHQSNDSITLCSKPLYTAPQAADTDKVREAFGEKFTKGDDYEPSDSLPCAGINVTSVHDHIHGNAIEFFAEKLADAQRRRDFVLAAIASTAAQAPVREGQDRGIELAFMGVPPGRCLHEFDCDAAGTNWSIWRCRHCGAERRR